MKLPGGIRRPTIANPSVNGSDSIQDNLCYTWINRLLAKRRAQYSNVLVALTKDVKRLSQFVGQVLALDDYSDFRIYSYEPWEGLSEYDRAQGNFRPTQIEQRASGEYAQIVQLANQATAADNLRQVLQHMGGVLRARKAVLLLKWMETETRNSALIQALRAWAHDRQIMVRGSFVVLFAGNLTAVLDPLTIEGVAQVTPPLADASERGWQIDQVASQLEVRLSDEERSQLVQGTSGLDLHQLEAVLVEAYHQSVDRTFPLEIIKGLKSELIRQSQLVEVEEPDPHGFAGLGGYEALKSFLKEQVVKDLREPSKVALWGTKLPRGLVLFGPPGTGKTVFAKALARETDLPFINFRTENLWGSLLGQSGQQFAAAIRLVEQMSPAIVFIDEIDRLGREPSGRGDGASEESLRVFNQVLEWRADPKCRSIIVGTTNMPESLSKRFTRPQRIQHLIPFLYPDEEARRQILAIHLGLTGVTTKPPLALDDSALNEVLMKIAARTKDYSGAELEMLVMQARRCGMNSGSPSMSAEHLEQALAQSQINMSQRQEEKEHYLQLAQTYTRDCRLLEAILTESESSTIHTGVHP
jgi:SpoVK/Ycf46/Vps4 family AAA+-type ATPase